MAAPAKLETYGDDEPRWHASLAAAVCLVLYVTLPPKLTFGPLWLFPLIVFVLLVPLTIFSPFRRHESLGQRIAAIVLIGILNALNIISLILLVHAILHPAATHKIQSGGELFLAGAQIWFTNMLVFAQWYWELDAGGPERRAHARSAAEIQNADFLFPQMAFTDAGVKCVDRSWKPLFMDYLFLSFTCSSAFSPADSFPLSRRAKALMLSEALVSLITIAIVVSRAIGILG